MKSIHKNPKIRFAIQVITPKIWLVLACVVLFSRGIVPGWKEKPADFNNYYVAATLLSQGFSIQQFYDYTWFNTKAKDMGIPGGAKFSPFPPVTAYLYLPLTLFKPLLAKRIFLVLNISLLVLIAFGIRKKTDWPLQKVLLFLSLFTVPMGTCLNLGQIYLVIGFLLLLALGQLLTLKKPKLLGFCVGILAAIKYFPILFLGYGLRNKKKKSILLFALIGILIPSLVVLLFDSEAYTIFFNHFVSHTQGDLLIQGKHPVGFQSIDSLLNNMFVYDQIKNPSPPFKSTLLKPIIKMALLATIITSLFIALKKNHYKTTPVLVSIGIIGAFVILPASASYHFLMLLWPILCLFLWLDSYTSKQALYLFSLFVLFCFSATHNHIPDIDQYPIIDLLVHYPRFWGLLCLFLFLVNFYGTALKKNYG